MIDYPRLFRLRLLVARYGEMDCMGWWNTQGVLGPKGRFVFGRGFPRTASFAQARAVFAVARARSREVWSPVSCATLWNLPAEVEDGFEDHWQSWTDRAVDWQPFFEGLAKLQPGRLLEELRSQSLIDAPLEAEVRDLRRSAEDRAVLLPGIRPVDDVCLGLLAAGHARGEKGALAVPYARLEG